MWRLPLALDPGADPVNRGCLHIRNCIWPICAASCMSSCVTVRRLFLIVVTVLRDMLYLRNNIKAMNKRAQLIYESREGTILSAAQEEQLPFDVSADHIELQDYDYGIWYMDALEHPRKYEGKTIAYNVKVYPVDLYKSNAYVAGREAMVCCSDDTSLIGLWVYTKQLKPKALSWIRSVRQNSRRIR